MCAIKLLLFILSTLAGNHLEWIDENTFSNQHNLKRL